MLRLTEPAGTCNSLDFVQVDDKYEYSLDNKDNLVHGWISSTHPKPMGFWIITPSNEFKNGGPLKRELTSHVGPTSLVVRFFHQSYLPAQVNYLNWQLCDDAELCFPRCFLGRITLETKWS
jgi:hypothetical protein